MAKGRLLVVSDAHFFNPQYYESVIRGGQGGDPPSRLSTDVALGDAKQNPFHALILLARRGTVSADALICCGDLTLCADPTAMNLGWLQLHRLAQALSVGEPVMTVGNHDIDSRFKVSGTLPQRMLRLLDPPFPTSIEKLNASFWANGYCIVDRTPFRLVLLNTCALHGYQTEQERQLDHGFVPDAFFAQLTGDLSDGSDAKLNILVCHHHPTELDLPAEDKSVISNGDQLLQFLTGLAPPSWLVLHGHRHLPAIAYAGADPRSPTVFSAGSLAVNLHLRLQTRATNQFYVIEVEDSDEGVRGTYEAWTWNQYEGEWRKGQDSPALSARGGFGNRSSPAEVAAAIASLVPPYASGAIAWSELERRHEPLRYVLPQHRRSILDELGARHGVDWESGTGRVEDNPELLKLGRRR